MTLEDWNKREGAISKPYSNVATAPFVIKINHS